ncbi:uncharacterized protein FOMMEDRAFT_137607 [Fomitiporia mediterranea MF3/22]|uniref:Uncharacterized protein n=1 Tax=Fomitiporia mediterranea (strain MF3/22) TaxID=694068 RepID=R7SF90_FOMME|nr:uncharacterized protein FOMMEDRAFT_137607 [Fomitiporia mediterranea MF3/22]EJC97391.1 hypothetical protein FOMMEDRAFT_137607 [Fomitiporia mediterranea MF3/22]
MLASEVLVGTEVYKRVKAAEVAVEEAKMKERLDDKISQTKANRSLDDAEMEVDLLHAKDSEVQSVEYYIS